jgi:hypothetical protein
MGVMALATGNKLLHLAHCQEALNAAAAIATVTCSAVRQHAIRWRKVEDGIAALPVHNKMLQDLNHRKCDMVKKAVCAHCLAPYTH